MTGAELTISHVEFIQKSKKSTEVSALGKNVSAAKSSLSH